MDARFVDLKLISEDATYRDEDGVEHQVEWVTIDLALDTAHVEAVPGVVGAVTGSAGAQGRGTSSRVARYPHPA